MINDGTLGPPCPFIIDISHAMPNIASTTEHLQLFLFCLPADIRGAFNLYSFKRFLRVSLTNPKTIK